MADLDLRFDPITEEFYDQQLAAIRQWARAHPLQGPVSLEIGSNRGRFLRGLATARPDHLLLGIELRKSWAEQANRSFERHGIQNATVLRADAAMAIPILIDPGQLAEVFVFYPDPWWKTRHQKRRIVRPDMLDLLAQKMRPHAPLWIRTDVGPLANAMRAVLNAHDAFEPLPLAEFPAPPLPHSERDVVTIRNKLPVQLLYYRRKSGE